MNTTKMWKRVVSVVVAAVLMVGMIPLTELMSVDTYAATSPTTLYLKPNANWKVDNARFAAYFFGNGEAWASMTDSDGDGVYEVDALDGYPSVIFCRMNPSATANNWNNKWNQTADLTVPTDGTNCYTVAEGTWDNGGGYWSVYPGGYFVAGSAGLCGEDWSASADRMTENSDGTYSITFSNIPAGNYEFKVVKDGSWAVASWPSDGSNRALALADTSNVTITFNPSDGSIYVNTYARQDVKTLSSDEVYYVDVDLVDYFNNSRVSNRDVYGYSADNQGEWMGAQDAVFSYYNNLISQQVTNTGYAYPLYFGPLHFIKSRYSLEVGSTSWNSLGNWSSAANVALASPDSDGATNTSAVVQGLVGKTLDANGNLTDPKNGNPLLYFNQAAQSWTNNGYSVMKYYPNLQFPFVMQYDENTRVTKYSYSSAENYAVYYDYASSQLYASDTHVKDINGASGFYPLNEPDDADNEVNNGFGAKFTLDFTVGDDGKLATGEPITFEFTGDDDVWVFIDGVLVLDMGGAHAKAHGKIDFADLSVTVDNTCSVTDSYLITSDPTYESSSYRNKGLSNYLYKSDTEERATVAASTKDPVSFSTLGLDFNYSDVHTMTVFYMERGMFESNFSMEFTMVPVPSGLTISKNLNDAEINAGILDEISAVEDFDFALSASSPSDISVVFSEYTLTEKYTGKLTTVSANGTTSGQTYKATVSGITNYTYAHSFFTANGEDAFIPGTTFTITESTKGIFSYSGTRWVIYNAKDGYADITSQVKTGSSNTSSKTAAFTMGEADDNTAYSYAVSFINTLELGSLTLTKDYADTNLADYATREYVFTLKLDLDGDKGVFEPAAYADVVYTVGEEEFKTDKNGQFKLKYGQTATFEGIPAGAKYQIVEEESDLYSVSSSENLTGTITTGAIDATITNQTTEIKLDKTIYVTKGAETAYTMDELSAISGITVSSEDLTVTFDGNAFNVTGHQVGKAQYTYSGTRDDGAYVTGTVTVFIYEATEKTYVFDFGLASDLAATTGSGLFEGGTYRISGDNAIATLIAVEAAAGNTQTTITFSGSPSIDDQGVCSASVVFRPVAFMSKIESYTYTVYIIADGVTQAAFINSGYDPEMGTVVSSTIRVMPANSVYYEDNFNISGTDSTQKIIFSGNGPTTAPTKTQSNDQTTHYGYDNCYNGGYAQSNGSATTLTGTYVNAVGTLVQGQYAYFTFTGTGFDLISRTNSTSAGLAVYVFETDGYYANDLSYVTDLTFKGTTNTLADMVFVNNYYNNGDLQQVPVVSVRLDSRKTYTVYIQAVGTNYSTSAIIDGLRIYNPLADTSDYLAGEQGTTVDELRVLYLNRGKISLAARSEGVIDSTLESGTIVENMENANYSIIMEQEPGTMTVDDLEAIYVHGPNNEMYLPDEFGIKFSYRVTDSDWSLQLGAKALSSSKTVSVYARKANGTYDFVDEVTVESTTDMYYDLTDLLSGYGQVGQTYDIVIISDIEDSRSNFVSLTTVKHSGITLN